MPLSGLKSGLAIRGMQSGILSGNTLGSVQSGYSGGLQNRIPNRDGMLNPVNLSGDKKPLLYGLADDAYDTGGNTTNLADVANTGNRWVSNGSVVSRPIAYPNVLGGRAILKYDGSASVMEALNALSTARNAYTVMCMVKLNGQPGMSIIDTNATTTAGGIYVATPASGASAYQIRSRLYSASSVYSMYTSDVGFTNATSGANTPEEFKDYMLLTCKFRLAQPTGSGSEQHLFINGRRHQILSGADNFSVSTTTFTIPTLGIGNNPSTQNSLAQGFELGMALVLPYWLEYAEQQKIENYFRWYYNKSF